MGSVKCSVYMGSKKVATGTLGGSDLMSVSSAVAKVTETPLSFNENTTRAITLGPGIIDTMHNNVAESTKVSNIIPKETDTKFVRSRYTSDTGYDSDTYDTIHENM